MSSHRLSLQYRKFILICWNENYKPDLLSIFGQVYCTSVDTGHRKATGSFQFFGETSPQNAAEEDMHLVAVLEKTTERFSVNVLKNINYEYRRVMNRAL